MFLASNQFPILQSGLLVGALSIVVLIVFIIGTKTHLATFNLSFKAKDHSLGIELSSDFCDKSLKVYSASTNNEATTSNQSILNGLVQSSLISTFFLSP